MHFNHYCTIYETKKLEDQPCSSMKQKVVVPCFKDPWVPFFKVDIGQRGKKDHIFTLQVRIDEGKGF